MKNTYKNNKYNYNGYAPDSDDISSLDYYAKLYGIDNEIENIPSALIGIGKAEWLDNKSADEVFDGYFGGLFYTLANKKITGLKIYEDREIYPDGRNFEIIDFYKDV